MTKSKINILSIHAYGLAFGGDETRLLNQCRMLDRNKFNSIICTPTSSKAYMSKHFEIYAVKVIHIKTIKINPANNYGLTARFYRLVNIFLFSFQLLKIAATEKIDIIDARLLTGGFYAIILKAIFGLPVVVTLYHKSECNSLLRRVSKYFLRFSDCIVCDSAIRTKELRDWIGSEKPEYLVIPSPIELAFSFDMELEEVRKKNEQSRKVIIGQIAGVVRYKGQDILINAFIDIARKYDHAELWIIGFPRNIEYYEELIKMVKLAGLESKVRFINYNGFIGNIFNSIDIQVHATRWDSLPNSILEGMSVGKPLIASTVGGIPDVVIDKETGLLFDIERPATLIACLDHLISDMHLRKWLGQAAQKRFNDCYSPGYLTNKLEVNFYKIYNLKYSHGK